MKYVVVDEQGGPVRTPWPATWLDPRPYLSELPNLEGDLPPGARAFASDPEHYNFYGERCAKDLRLCSWQLTDESGELTLEARFAANVLKHDRDLVIRYSNVRSIDLRANDGSSVISRLGDVRLDEILPHEAGCSHEIALISGHIHVVCGDLTAVWVPVKHSVVVEMVGSRFGEDPTSEEALRFMRRAGLTMAESMSVAWRLGTLLLDDVQDRIRNSAAWTEPLTPDPGPRSGLARAIERESRGVTDAVREHLRVARLRPRMYDLRSFTDVISFLMGMDVATDRLPEDFHFWLDLNKTQHDNLVWPGHLRLLAYTDRAGRPMLESYQGGWDEDAVNVIWACVEEFLDERDGDQLTYLERRAARAFGEEFVVALPEAERVRLAEAERVRLAEAERLVDAVLRLKDDKRKSGSPHWALTGLEMMEEGLAAFEPEFGARLRGQLADIDAHQIRVRVLAENHKLADLDLTDVQQRWELYQAVSEKSWDWKLLTTCVQAEAGHAVPEAWRSLAEQLKREIAVFEDPSSARTKQGGWDAGSWSLGLRREIAHSSEHLALLDYLAEHDTCEGVRESSRERIRALRPDPELARLVSRLVELCGHAAIDPGDHRKGSAVYTDAIEQGVGWDVLRACVQRETDETVANWAVAKVMERVDAGERPAWLEALPERWRVGSAAEQKLRELAILEDPESARTADGRWDVDDWSDWLQFRLVERSENLALLDCLAERGQYRRIRHLARERIRKLA